MEQIIFNIQYKIASTPGGDPDIVDATSPTLTGDSFGIIFFILALLILVSFVFLLTRNKLWGDATKCNKLSWKNYNNQYTNTKKINSLINVDNKKILLFICLVVISLLCLMFSSQAFAEEKNDVKLDVDKNCIYGTIQEDGSVIYDTCLVKNIGNEKCIFDEGSISLDPSCGIEPLSCNLRINGFGGEVLEDFPEGKMVPCGEQTSLHPGDSSKLEFFIDGIPVEKLREFADKDISVFSVCLTPAESYDIKYNFNDGTEVKSQTFTYGDYIPMPPAPTKDYYSFYGWYTDPDFTTRYYFNEPVTCDLNLNAKWGEMLGRLQYIDNKGDVVTYYPVINEAESLRLQKDDITFFQSALGNYGEVGDPIIPAEGRDYYTLSDLASSPFVVGFYKINKPGTKFTAVRSINEVSWTDTFAFSQTPTEFPAKADSINPDFNKYLVPDLQERFENIKQEEFGEIQDSEPVPKYNGVRIDFLCKAYNSQQDRNGLGGIFNFFWSSVAFDNVLSYAYAANVPEWFAPAQDSSDQCVMVQYEFN